MLARVAMRGDSDSSVACLAMLTKQSYDTVLADFNSVTAGRDIRHDGINEWAMRDYLTEHGYALAAKYRTYMPRNQWRRDWPLAEPFAANHYVQTYESNGRFHYVVWNWTGLVFDPAPGVEAAQLITNYSRVNLVVGVVPLPKMHPVPNRKAYKRES